MRAYSVLSAVSLGALLVLGACSAPNEPAVDPTPSEVILSAPRWSVGLGRDSSFTASWPFRSYSGVGESQRRVVRSAEEFQALWLQLQEGRSPLLPAPAVDFGEEMVVFAAMGARPNGGHAINIRHVTLIGETLWVVVEEETAGRDCFTTQAFVQPTAALVVPRATTAVRFRVIATTISCR